MPAVLRRARKNQYQPMTARDLQVSTVHYDIHDTRTWIVNLPWFWRMDISDDISNNQLVSNCESYHLGLNRATDMLIVFCVCWITMKMTTLRLEEESTILLAEMGTVHRSYCYLASQWQKRSLHSQSRNQRGHANYAER